MKKALFVFAAMLLISASRAVAQIPVCNNQSGLENRIDAIESRGWVETSRTFQPIFYFTVPETPYVIGTLQVIFGVACEPGEGCPQIALLYQETAVQTSENACHWQPDNPRN